MAESSHIFSLKDRGLKLTTAADIAPHIAPLTAADAPATIHEINLQGNTIGVEAAAALAPHLSKLGCLRVANLADIFTSRLLAEIPPALDSLLIALLDCPQLHTVDLSDNAFGLNTQAPLVEFLRAHTPLRHLILNNNGLGPEAGTMVAGALSELAAVKRAAAPEAPRLLETIVCGRNRLENGSAAAWAMALAAHAPALREVRLAQNGIRFEGTSLLVGAGLKNAAQLEVLDMQDNLFTALTAQRLAAAVGGWRALRVLDVQDTLLRARGAEMVMQALDVGLNDGLEVLRLQYNEIRAKSVAALLRTIRAGRLPNLRRVELNGNSFAEDDPSAADLRAILEERREEAQDRGEDEDWGMDELDEMEEDDDEGVLEYDDVDEVKDDDAAEAQKDDDNGVGVAAKAEKELQLADEAEAENVAQRDDKDVDALADRLGKTDI